MKICISFPFVEEEYNYEDDFEAPDDDDENEAEKSGQSVQVEVNEYSQVSQCRLRSMSTIRSVSAV